MPDHEPTEEPEASFSGRELSEELVAGVPESPPKPQDLVESFVTSRRSVYTYDETGRTTRFKTANGELQPTQDLTVFVDIGASDFRDVLKGFMTINPRSNSVVQIIEQGDDGQTRVIESIDDVLQPDKLALALTRDGEIITSKSVSLFPAVGKYVYDSRTFDENGVKRTERHLGHKVTSIKNR